MDGLRTLGAKYIEQHGAKQIVNEAGENLPRAVTENQTDDFMRGLAELPEYIDMVQLRGMQADVNQALRVARKNGEDTNNLINARRSIEMAMNNPNLENVDPAIAEELINSLTTANDYWFSLVGSKGLFERGAGKTFRQVDRGIFKGPGVAGQKYEDEMFNVLDRDWETNNR